MNKENKYVYVDILECIFSCMNIDFFSKQFCTFSYEVHK